MHWNLKSLEKIGEVWNLDIFKNITFIDFVIRLVVDQDSVIDTSKLNPVNDNTGEFRSLFRITKMVSSLTRLLCVTRYNWSETIYKTRRRMNIKSSCR